MTKPSPKSRNQFAFFKEIPTRWADNDMYGHVNNVVYYSWFDTLVNTYLIDKGGLQLQGGQWMGWVVETQCNYFSPLAYPQTIEAGLCVEHMGRSSVRYAIGLFAPGEERCAAQGHFVHVYVHSSNRRPIALPPPLVSALEALRVAKEPLIWTSPRKQAF